MPHNVIELRPAASASAPVQATVDLEIEPGELLGLGSPGYVLALESGFMVVDPEGRAPLAFFGERGALERRVGSFGAGPGDFSTILSYAANLGDQILVPDYGNRRLVMLDAASNAWVASEPFPPAPNLPLQWVGVSPSRIAGSVMAINHVEGSHHLEIILLDRASFKQVEAISPARTEPPSGVYPTAQTLLAGPSGGTFAIASPTLGLIEVFDENADPVRTFHIEQDGPAAIDGRDRMTLAQLAGTLEQQRFDRRMQLLREQGPALARGRLEAMKALRPSAEARVEDEYPSFIHARFDARTGWLWIARPIRGDEIRRAPYEVPWTDLRGVATRWEAYSPDGAFQRRVAVPFGTIVTDVRGNRLFGIRIDSAGARRVVVLGAAGESRGSR